MWSVKRISGTNRWEIYRNDYRKGEVTVDDEGFNGTIDLTKYDNTFRDVAAIESLIAHEIAAEQLLMST